MEVKAKFRHVRSAPRKARRVIDQVRGLGVASALDRLRFDRRAAARNIDKLIRSALANANEKGGINIERLYVKKICVDGGPVLKRWMPRARGSASSIHKRLAHLTVVLDERI